MGVLFRARTSESGMRLANKVKSGLKKWHETVVNPKLDGLKRKPSLANEEVTSVLGSKRNSEDARECQNVKRIKMDHCQDILAKLMKSDWGSPASTALPADSLKTRLGDAILRVVSKINCLRNTSTNVATSQEEEKRLQRKQDEAKTEAEANVAELASPVKAEAKLMKQPEQQQCFDPDDDSLRAMRASEALTGKESVYDVTGSLMQHLELYIKAEYMLVDYYDNKERFYQDIDLEEGR